MDFIEDCYATNCCTLKMPSQAKEHIKRKKKVLTKLHILYCKREQFIFIISLQCDHSYVDTIEMSSGKEIDF